MLPQLAIFDMDGLIFDSERLFSSELAVTMNEYGYRLTKENYIRTLGRSFDDARILMKEMYGEDYPFDEISNITRKRVSELTPDIKPGIPELLDFFKNNGVECCVASSTAGRYVVENLENTGLKNYFSFVVGGEEVERSKPAPDIFLAALKKAGTPNISDSTLSLSGRSGSGNALSNGSGALPPDSALVLEDSESGVRAAISAKIPVICIPDMKELPKELIPKTLLTAKSAREVLDFIGTR